MKAAEVKEAFKVFQDAVAAEDVEATKAAIEVLDKAINAKPPVIIKLTAVEYGEMLKRLEWLDCLEAAGVDNWVGIEEAIRIKRESVDV